MKISDYYFENAQASLNASLLFLLPAFLIALGNIFILDSSAFMLFCLPFAGTSLVYYQLYLSKMKKSGEAASVTGGPDFELLRSENLLPLYENHLNPAIILFSPGGKKIGEIRGSRPARKKVRGSRGIYILSDENLRTIATYGVFKNKIDVYNGERTYVGSFFKRQGEAVFVLAGGEKAALATSSRMFMDVKVIKPDRDGLCRLRRGILPLEWARYFREPNTPVFSIAEDLPINHRLLFISVLVNEFFVER